MKNTFMFSSSDVRAQQYRQMKRLEMDLKTRLLSEVGKARIEAQVNKLREILVMSAK